MLLNSQIANFSFLSLFISMICYWIGPLSRDLFKQPTRKNNKDILSGFAQEAPTEEASLMAGLDQNSILEPNAPFAPETLFPGQNSLFSSEREDLNSKFSSESFYSTTAPQMSLSLNPPKIHLDISQGLQLMGRFAIIISNLLLVILLCNRWKESGHFPLSNLYESLMFLSWSFTLIHLLIENWTKGEKSEEMSMGKYIGAITTPSALFTNAFATFTLPKEMQGSSSLVPALQSNWLMMHVSVMILSYAALILGSLLSIAFLIITIKKNNVRVFEENAEVSNKVDGFLRNVENSDGVRITTTQFNLASPNASYNLNQMTKENKRNSIASMLDNLSYRILGIGFPFLTIGILSGAVWANEAWGSYWSWDPKETWALLTWLIYAIYLHTRLNKGWEGKKPAVIASLGFVVVWICYLGVNLIGEGLHSYGWITQ